MSTVPFNGATMYTFAVFFRDDPNYYEEIDIWTKQGEVEARRQAKIEADDLYGKMWERLVRIDAGGSGGSVQIASL